METLTTVATDQRAMSVHKPWSSLVNEALKGKGALTRIFTCSWPMLQKFAPTVLSSTGIKNRKAWGMCLALIYDQHIPSFIDMKKCRAPLVNSLTAVLFSVVCNWFQQQQQQPPRFPLQDVQVVRIYSSDWTPQAWSRYIHIHKCTYTLKQKTYNPMQAQTSLNS